MNKSRNSTRTH